MLIIIPIQTKKKNMRVITLKLVISIIFIVMFVTQISCGLFSNWNMPGASEYREISRSNRTERKARFNSYSIEKQIDIYLFAMCCVEPSDVEFESYLIVDGESKLPHLTERIKLLKDSRDKGNLIGAIYEIDRDCNCVANNPNIMRVLKENESQRTPNDDEGDKGWKKQYSWYLFELQRKSDPKIQNAPNPYSIINVQ